MHHSFHNAGGTTVLPHGVFSYGGLMETTLTPYSRGERFKIAGTLEARWLLADPPGRNLEERTSAPPAL